MGWFDWIGPTSLSKRRGWDSLPAPQSERKSAPDFVPLNGHGATLDVRTLTFGPSFGSGLGYGALGEAGNSAVYACLKALATSIAEPELRVYRVTDGQRVAVPASPLSDLLARPNPYLSLDALLAYVSDSLHVAGNAYWRKLRAGDPETGNVVELWPISPTRIEPVTRPGSTDFVSFYRYTSGQGRPEELDPTNVVHFRLGLDDRDHRLGSSPLKRLVREISSDAQATRYADRLLANLAINGLTLSFDKESPAISQEVADELKLRIAAAYGGDNAGATAVLSPGATLTALGFSPEQMDLKVLHRVPEERISAVLGVPAIVAGLGAGLDRSTYSNARESREMFTEQTLIPLWRALAATITMGLVPDFASDPAVVVEFDLSGVRALADDQTAQATRLQTLVAAGIMTEDEARAVIGLPPLGANRDEDAAQRSLAGRTERRARIVALDTTRALRGSVERKSADDIPNGLNDLREDAYPEWELEITRYFNGQARRVTRRLREGLDTAGDLIPDSEAALLGETLTPLQLSLFDDVTRLVMAELAAEFTVDDPLTRQYLRSAGSQIVGITDTTRAAVQAALIEGQQAGEGIPELARRLRNLPAFDEARARVVARTELAHSTSTASLSSYKASGLVSHVTVLDGDYDAACQAMNGRTFPLDQAPPTLQHPNCTRAFAPVLAQEAAG